MGSRLEVVTEDVMTGCSSYSTARAAFK